MSLHLPTTLKCWHTQTGSASSLFGSVNHKPAGVMPNPAGSLSIDSVGASSSAAAGFGSIRWNAPSMIRRKYGSPR